MPRKKPQKISPLSQFVTRNGKEWIDVAIWANLADEGGRGSWKKRLASDAFEILLKEYADRLFNTLHPPSVCDITLKRLFGHRQTSKLVNDIKKILRRHRITFAKTALWLLAERVQKSFHELRDAIVGTQDNPCDLPVNSREALIRQKILKGTF